MSLTAELSNSEVVYNLMGAGHEQSPAEEPIAVASAEPAPAEEAPETGDSVPEPAEASAETPAEPAATASTFRVASLGVDIPESELTPAMKAVLAAVDQNARQFQSRADRAENEARRLREDFDRAQQTTTRTAAEPQRPQYPPEIEAQIPKWAAQAERLGEDPEVYIQDRLDDLDLAQRLAEKRVEARIAPDLQPLREQREIAKERETFVGVMRPMVKANREIADLVDPSAVAQEWPHFLAYLREEYKAGRIGDISLAEAREELVDIVYQRVKNNKVSNAPNQDGAQPVNVASAGVAQKTGRPPVLPPAPRGGAAPKSATPKAASTAAPKSNTDVIYELMNRRG